MQGRPVLLGNAPLLHAHGIDSTALRERLEALRREGQTVVLVAVDGRLAGLLWSPCTKPRPLPRSHRRLARTA